jgi:hypothetical protein
MARRTFTDRVFAQVGVQTGDGRLITPDALRFPDGDQPLRLASEDWGMHLGAVTAGAITSQRIEGENLLSSGWVDDEIPGGAAAIQLIDSGVPMGVSLDLDDVVVEIVDTLFDEHGDPIDDERMAATRRALARFDTYTFRLGASPLRSQFRPNAVTAAAGDPDVDDGDIWWVFAADEILERLVSARGRGATIVDMPAFDRALMGLDDVGAGEDTGSDTTDAAEPDPVAASSAPVAGRQGAHITSGETPVDPIVVADLQRTLVAAAGRSVARALSDQPLDTEPPAAWFEMPEPDQHTPLHVGDDGQVYGHVWSGACHTSSQAGQCLRAPRSSPGLPWFHTGYTVTAEGDRVATGVLTIGGGHADETLGIVPAREHYDDTATAWADVRIVEGRFGGWACGAARPGLTQSQLRAIRGSVPSGDWRGSGGGSELIAVHQVNHPGYPVARFDRRGRPLAIVAAGALTAGAPPDDLGSIAIRRLSEQVTELQRTVAAPARAALRAAGTARARQRLRSR